MKKQTIRIMLGLFLLCMGMNLGNAQTSCVQIGEDQEDQIFEHHFFSGVLVTTGQTLNLETGKSDLYCAAFDGLGSMVWSKTIDFQGNETAAGSLITPDNELIMAGSFDDGTSKDIVLVRIDASGGIVWSTRIFVEDEKLTAADVLLLPNGNVSVVGNMGTQFSYLATLNASNGNVLGASTFTFSRAHTVQRAVLATGGGVAIIASGNNADDFFFYKLGSSTDFLKTISLSDSFDPSGDHMPRDLIELGNGEFIIVGGKTLSNNACSVGFAIHTDITGQPITGTNLTGNFPCLGSGRNILESVEFDSQTEEIVVAGKIDNRKFLGRIDGTLGLINSSVFDDTGSIFHDLSIKNDGGVLAVGEDVTPVPSVVTGVVLAGLNGTVVGTLADLTACCNTDPRNQVEIGQLNFTEITSFKLLDGDTTNVQNTASDAIYGDIAVSCPLTFTPPVSSSTAVSNEPYLKTYFRNKGHILTVEVSELLVGQNYSLHQSDGTLALRGIVEDRKMSIEMPDAAGVYILKIEKNDKVYYKRFLYQK